MEPLPPTTPQTHTQTQVPTQPSRHPSVSSSPPTEDVPSPSSRPALSTTLAATSLSTSTRSRPASRSSRIRRQARSPPLTISEPSLRFPRPLGNHQLANWISTSNPDIMRQTNTATPPAPAGEESGLSESTYELVSGTDSESQDENYNESMEESIGSLDFHRPDDVQSLADTEHTGDGDGDGDGDDDESVADEASQQAPEDDVYDLVVDTDESKNQDKARDLKDPKTEEDEDTGIKAQLRRTRTHLDSSTHSTGMEESQMSLSTRPGARIRSSFDYTHRSLLTPSMSASEVTETPDKGGELESLRDDEMAALKPRPSAWSYISQHSPAALRDISSVVIMAVVAGSCLGLAGLYFTPNSNLSPNDTSVSIAAVNGIPTTVTSCEPLPESTTSLSHEVYPSTVDLITVEDAPSDEWFTYKQPTVELVPAITSNGDIFVQIPQDVQKKWLSKGCVTITACKEDTPIDTVISAVENGLLINFPSEPARGTVNVTLATTCRPKVHKVITMDFGQGPLWSLVDKARQLSQDVSKFVQPAAGNIEQQICKISKTVGGLPQQLKHEVDLFSDNVRTRFVAASAEQRQMMLAGYRGELTTITDAVFGAQAKLAKVSQSLRLPQVPGVRDVKEQTELRLLDAQISAAIWWYRVTGRAQEATEYHDKAVTHMSERAARYNTGRETSVVGAEVEEQEPSWGARLFDKRKPSKPECERGSRKMCRCQGGKGLCPCRSTQECVPVR